MVSESWCLCCCILQEGQATAHLLVAGRVLCSSPHWVSFIGRCLFSSLSPNFLTLNFFSRITANQGFYLLGLYHLSPTYASAIQNMVPAITFVLAAVLRLEQVDLGRRHGVAKVVGTVVSVGGATVITLYKGLPLFAAHNLHAQAFLTWTSGSPIFNWTLGCVFILGHCLSWSGWMVLQVPVLKRYPARLSVISLTCVFGLLQFLVIAAFTEEDLSRWKVNSGGELFTILYAVSISTVNCQLTWSSHGRMMHVV